MIQVELLQVEKSYAVDKEGDDHIVRSYTITARYDNNSKFMDFEVFALDDGEKVSAELRDELLEAVKQFAEA